MAIYEFEGMRPRIGATSYVDPAATIIGDVTIGENCFIAPGAVLRGDAGAITIGDGSNVQDCSVLHGVSTVGKNTLLTHHVIVHQAIIGDNVMLGMGSIIMDFAEVGNGCIVGAGSIVVPGTKVPPGKTVIGVPGRVVGEVSERAKEEYRTGLGHYQSYPQRYPKGLKQIG